MKKINSLYIEFEPISGVVWSSLRLAIQEALKDHVVGVITWETGIKTTLDKDDCQIDWVSKENL